MSSAEGKVDPKLDAAMVPGGKTYNQDTEWSHWFPITCVSAEENNIYGDVKIFSNQAKINNQLKVLSHADKAGRHSP